jgi:hypothetical protein
MHMTASEVTTFVQFAAQIQTCAIEAEPDVADRQIPASGSTAMRGELLSALAICEDALAQNEQNIADQEVRVTRREATGVTAALSKSLLETFHQLRLSHLVRREAILRDLATLIKS